jgi:hypothetical protein
MEWVFYGQYRYRDKESCRCLCAFFVPLRRANSSQVKLASLYKMNILFKYYSNFAAVALASGIIAFKLAILVASGVRTHEFRWRLTILVLPFLTKKQPHLDCILQLPLKLNQFYLPLFH